MSNYIIIHNNQVFHATSLREIERNFSVDHSYLSKLIKKKKPKVPIKIKDKEIYIINNDDSNTNFSYFVHNNENDKYNFYTSLRKIEEDLKIDHSSLSKFINNKKYKSIGGGNRGRPTAKSTNNTEDNSNDQEKKKGYQIYKII